MTVTVLIRRNVYTDWLEAHVAQDGRNGENLLRGRKCPSVSDAKQRVRAELRIAIAAGVDIVWDVEEDGD
jgi:hypothetical protein